MSNGRKMFCTAKEEKQFKQYIDAVQAFNCYQEKELGITFKIAMRSMLYCNSMVPFSQLWHASLGLMRNAEAYISYWIPSLNNLVYDRNKTLSEYKNACSNFAFEQMFSKIVAFIPENKKAWQRKRCAALPPAVSHETTVNSANTNATDTKNATETAEKTKPILDAKKLLKRILKLEEKYTLDLDAPQMAAFEYLREICKD